MGFRMILNKLEARIIIRCAFPIKLQDLFLELKNDFGQYNYRYIRDKVQELVKNGLLIKKYVNGLTTGGRKVKFVYLTSTPEGSQLAQQFIAMLIEGHRKSGGSSNTNLSMYVNHSQ